MAVPGSLSTQWVPGTGYFEDKVKPNVADADVIIISVGGNDITSSLDISALQNIDKAIEDTYQLVSDIVENIRSMATEIRSINPDVDIVYCLYVDYGTATIQPWGLASQFLPEGTITNILVSAREQVPSDEGIILADLFGASQSLMSPLDEYLYDALHFNDKGQTMYAEEVFQSLGGVLIGPSPIGGAPNTPLNLNPNTPTVIRTAFIAPRVAVMEAPSRPHLGPNNREQSSQRETDCPIPAPSLCHHGP